MVWYPFGTRASIALTVTQGPAPLPDGPWRTRTSNLRIKSRGKCLLLQYFRGFSVRSGALRCVGNARFATRFATRHAETLLTGPSPQFGRAPPRLSLFDLSTALGGVQRECRVRSEAAVSDSRIESIETAASSPIQRPAGRRSWSLLLLRCGSAVEPVAGRSKRHSLLNAVTSAFRGGCRIKVPVSGCAPARCAALVAGPV